MPPPATPTKSRTTSPFSPSPSQPHGSTPARSTKLGGAAASPQVRAALAALRKQRQASASSSPNQDSPANSAEPDAFSTRETGTRRQSGSETHANGTAGSSAGSPFGSRRDEVVLEWAIKGEDKLIAEAKKSGRLNLASRTLSSVPKSVYSALLPRTSSYHPSNRQNKSQCRRDPPTDLKIASFDDNEAGEKEATWYEQQDLKTLNLSSNELASLEDEIGGFEDLEVLDLHNNLLASIPTSLASLVHLTSLNLSHNRLSSFPLQLLNLRLLRDLNLSGNNLSHLWPPDWKVALSDVLKPPGASPSATPESPDAGQSFWDSFPSSPFHRANQRVNLPHPSVSRAPFPLLTTLSVAENPLSRDALTQEGFELPPRLTHLDLSDCGIVDAALPPCLLATLKNLVELDLSRNDLADDLFSSEFFPLPANAASSDTFAPERLFPSLRLLDLSVNPIDSLASVESFLATAVRRPITYIGLAKPIQNLIYAEERTQRSGRRIGVPEGTEYGTEGVEVEVRVRECLLREEQVRRRKAFPPSESSRAREQSWEAEKPIKAGSLAPAAAAVPAPLPTARRPRSPSPPPSPSPAPSLSVPGSRAASPATSSRRAVVLEDWEVEAAAGLSTPAGRRRAAAQAARERAEKMQREEADKERLRLEKEREAAEERSREKERGEAEEMRVRMDNVRLTREQRSDGSGSQASDSTMPPPYSPRPASPSPSPVPAQSSHSAESPATLTLTEASPSDPAVYLVSSVMTTLPNSRTSINLSSRFLSSVPIPASGSTPTSLASPTTLDLSRNLLSSFPSRALETWGWGTSLRSLSLAHNRLGAIELLSTPLSPRGGLFPVLETLDLSRNQLSSSLSSPLPSAPSGGEQNSGEMPLLSVLAALAPNLVKLNLQHNRLASLAGVSALLLPPVPPVIAATGDSKSQEGRRGRGLEHLNVSENKITDVSGLCETAVEYAGLKRAEREMRWRLEEVDLGSNEISRLPPQLGHLPLHLVLHLNGNTFRIPRREVYENATEKRVIPWLREWLENLG
ncbi:hypothetical protein JCM11641_001901 [Rhodosporidiobolus odoratus]